MSVTREQILKESEEIYQGAMNEGKWALALRAKELQAKILGLFKVPRLPEVVRIQDMTEEQLQEFVTRLEKSDPDLKKLPFPT